VRAGPPERAAGAEAHVVDQDPDDVRRAFGVGHRGRGAGLRVRVVLLNDRLARLRGNAQETHGRQSDAHDKTLRQRETGDGVDTQPLAGVQHDL